MFHELTESYEGGKKALQDKDGSPSAYSDDSTYEYADSKASPQTPLFHEDTFEAPIIVGSECYQRYKLTWFVYDKSGNKIVVTSGIFRQ